MTKDIMSTTRHVLISAGHRALVTVSFQRRIATNATKQHQTY
jgi:hypothetical protein